MYYNFCRPHKTLAGDTPAMVAGLTDRVWTLADVLDIVDEAADPIIG